MVFPLVISSTSDFASSYSFFISDCVFDEDDDDELPDFADLEEEEEDDDEAELLLSKSSRLSHTSPFSSTKADEPDAFDDAPPKTLDDGADEPEDEPVDAPFLPPDLPPKHFTAAKIAAANMTAAATTKITVLFLFFIV